MVEILLPLEVTHYFLIIHISSTSQIKPTFTILWLIFWSQRNKICTVSSFSRVPQAVTQFFHNQSLCNDCPCRYPFPSNFTPCPPQPSPTPAQLPLPSSVRISGINSWVNSLLLVYWLCSFHSHQNQLTSATLFEFFSSKILWTMRIKIKITFIIKKDNSS